MFYGTLITRWGNDLIGSRKDLCQTLKFLIFAGKGSTHIPIATTPTITHSTNTLIRNNPNSISIKMEINFLYKRQRMLRSPDLVKLIKLLIQLYFT